MAAAWMAAAGAILLLPAFAPAVLEKPAPGQELSPRLDELASPAVVAEPARRQARRIGLPAHGPASLIRADGSVVVEVRVTGDVAERADALRAAGAEVLGVNPAYRSVTALTPPSALREMARLPGVEGVTEVLEPITSGDGGSGAETAAAECGSVNSEGDLQLKAAQARAQFGVGGAGVEVGVLSDSFDTHATAETRAAQDVATGDLPGPGNPCGKTTPVQVLQDFATNNTDEGRAMLQIVHDLAPDAALSFATAFGSQTTFANNIRNLRTAGAQVIVDDALYFEEPMFQDGPVAAAVNEVTAGGVAYFSSAGNSNIRLSGQDVSSWEAPSYRPAGSCPTAVPPIGMGSTDCMDFDPGPLTDDAFKLTIPAGRNLRIDLQWAEPWFGVETDIDAYLLDETTGAVLDTSLNDNPNTTQTPFEFVSHQNATAAPQDVLLAINRASGTATPRVKFVVMGGNALSLSEYPTSAGGDIVGPNIFAHNGADGAMSTAAVPFNNSEAIESFSSRGPVTHYFGPATGTTPAPPLSSPLVLAKPDIAATDGVLTTFFPPGPGANRFFGTSAAAPHAAAVAALQLDRNPGASVAEVKSAQKSTADPVDAFPAEAQGAGLLDALGAVGAIGDGEPPDTVITSGPPRKTKKKKVTVEFSSTEPGSSFQCKLDKGGFEPCASPKRVKAKKKGKHSFQVRAVDQTGLTDQTPASRDWKKKKKPKKNKKKK